MKRFLKAGLLLVCCALGAPALAQGTSPLVAAAPDNSGMDAELFYQLLLGELNVRGAEPAAGFALILDAARKTTDPSLYQRAVELAFEARNGDAALQAARAWKQAFPKSREANRYVLQILVALNRIPESTEPLKTEIALADAGDRAAVISMAPRIYARASDKKQAATVIEQALADYLNQPATGAAAWSAVGRMRMAAGDTTGALEAARRGQASNPKAEGPVLLALELMDPKLPQAEVLVRNYLQAQPLPEIRMGYARALLDAQRQQEALQQLQLVTRERPEFPEAWLAQGALLVGDNQLTQAETSLQKYIQLAQAQPANEERSRGLAQAYLSMAQVAEKRKDFTAAGAWLDRIDNSQDLIAAQNRRASILARQGKMAEARKLIQAIPERTPADARLKLSAEVSLLRDNKQYKPAYELLAKAVAANPKDADLLYDQAMMAEKLNDFPEMEKLLRQVMVLKPDYHHAYNALGFSFAERGVRLPEARQLIQKALEYAPGDPFITDSLGWVEFRMGNRADALRILQGAYKDRPDPEIAAHLGEVLWTIGERAQAEKVWREGMLLNNENETLLETIKRLRVQL
ncbi:tetratricopeptide repeat protein [Ramlibacter alkalitolerans]|uniref:Tetratricopeptide repeat protein n=1 Tax=Ramlibacter alkalitolerans TaxID=2039631 RepID=A0ABS1JQY4_9BURK|nr:tetratricopeptide repeat protein [Ramlibacter alkalitolerans]MBL0426670.1 tetratricopeptide repeat protein [Ramlibacter alkalitolerans]